MEELKPCPFCGGTQTTYFQSTAQSYFVICQTCRAYGPSEITLDKTIEAWNNRQT